MERLSNNNTELISSAKLEIQSFELAPEEKIIAYFSEFHLIVGFPYKIALIEDQHGNIRSSFRQWDTAYDLKRWHNGIYNLDRLRIITDEKSLAEPDLRILKQLLMDLENETLPQSIQSEGGIVIHGYEWQFGIDFNNAKINYQWTAATDDIELFVSIIEFIKNQYKHLKP